MGWILLLGLRADLIFRAPPFDDYFLENHLMGVRADPIWALRRFDENRDYHENHDFHENRQLIFLIYLLA